MGGGARHDGRGQRALREDGRGRRGRGDCRRAPKKCVKVSLTLYTVSLAALAGARAHDEGTLIET